GVHLDRSLERLAGSSVRLVVPAQFAAELANLAQCSAVSVGEPAQVGASLLVAARLDMAQAFHRAVEVGLLDRGFSRAIGLNAGLLAVGVVGAGFVDSV